MRLTWGQLQISCVSLQKPLYARGRTLGSEVLADCGVQTPDCNLSSVPVRSCAQLPRPSSSRDHTDPRPSAFCLAHLLTSTSCMCARK